MLKVKIPDFIKVYDVEKLVRLGRDHDGGYLINVADIEDSEYIISLGIFDDWSFEENFC